MPDLSVIIVSWNTRELLGRCLDTLHEAVAHLDVETIVIDNGSSDDTLAMLETRTDLTRVVANTENRGFAAANNQGLQLARAPIVQLLNSDAFVERSTIEQALAVFEQHPRAGVVGVRILNDDGSDQAGRGSFPTLGQDIAVSVGLDRLRRHDASAATVAGTADWVHGACIFARRVAVQRVGGLDTRFFMYSEEVDWCHRFWMSGWEVWYDPQATAIHLGGASSSTNDLLRRSALYRSRVGLRRRMSGRLASVTLWLGMLGGLAVRALARGAVELTTRRRVGRQSARDDVRLFAEIARSDPFARWAVS